MPSQVHRRGPATPEMNITPLIDVVFLLIVFFMLVNTIKMQEAVEMFLPDLDDSQARELASEGFVIVNVAPQRFQRTERTDNPLRFDSTARMVQIGSQQQFPMDDLSGVTAALERRMERNPELEVVLRADSALRYDEVQPVMDAVTAAGISRVNLMAYDPTQE
ncbi:MAG: biopolymer transporter ExbD [Phycisphaeraceae bacterium]